MSDEVIETILSSRYYLENEHSWEDVCKRVSNFVGDTDEERKLFYDLMAERRGIPNSPCLFNAGTDNPQMSACFVLDLDDSIDSIYKLLWDSARIMKSGGGFGVNLSKIRQKNARVGKTNGVASGVVSFLTLIDASVETIKQGSKRRGAAMGVLAWNHPDIIDFITCKHTEGKIHNFNLSVLVEGEFFKLAKEGAWDKVICETIEDDGTRKPIKFGEIWNGIVEGAWRNGEPALMYKDNINRNNKLIGLGEITASNPCSEQFLLPYESCNLFALNLNAYVNGGQFQWEKFKKDIQTSVLFLNRVLDKNAFPIPEIEKASKYTRKIGLGLMGVHDAMLLQRICYDSPEGLEFARLVYEFLQDVAEETSRSLAERDGNFPAHEKSEWKEPMRNGCLTTQQPTGSVSILAGNVSSGIEPVFNWVYMRKNTVGKEFLIVHPIFDKDLKTMCAGDEGLYNDIVNQIFKEGTLQNVACLPDNVKRLYRCALDIDYKDHLNMLAVVQKEVDSGVSKTINMPFEATKEDVADIYVRAHELGCKGVALYRTGSRNEVVLTKGGTDKNGFIEFVKDGKLWKRCPECGHEFQSDSGGCMTCSECGYTHCSN